MSWRIFIAILRKDVLSLVWLVLLATLLFALDVVLLRLELMPTWVMFRIPLLLLTATVLILSVLQLDSPVSLVDDWLCRPVPRKELVAAKLFLLFAVFYLPRAAASFVVDLSLGCPFAEALQDALLLQETFFLLLLPVLLMTAVITRTVIQGIGVLIALFVCIFAIPTPFIHPPGPLEPGIGDAMSATGFGWLETLPAIAVAVPFAVLVFWLVFWRRRLLAARAGLVVAAVITLLVVLLPAWILSWPTVFGLQASVATATDIETNAAEQIRLRSKRACFPATRLGSLPIDSEYTLARQAEGLTAWSDEELAATGPDSLTFFTSIGVGGLPLDWRVKLNYAQADYLAGTELRFSLRPARYMTDAGAGSLAHSWVLPGSAARQLEAGSNTALRLTYYLTVLAPRNFQLPTDGRRHGLPGLGYCDARLASSGDRIQVECLTTQGRPAQVSAELEGIAASRAYGWADFAPRWARLPLARRVSLSIDSPRLARHDRVRVTAWNVAGYLEKSLTLPGILGGATDTCPLPGAEGNRFQQARWRDAAPHETQSVAVDAGVQLEVLDFGGSGSPVLLLPGLGATAHSYDELAPLLAKNHRVVALTRRGTGSSSKPDFGFDTPRLGQDVLRVMDALDLSKVLLVGHSIAGDELTWLGGHHPERFSGLVYLDAAYDRSRDPSQGDLLRLRELGRLLPPEPPMPLTALANYGAMSEFLRERGHVRLPEGELIAFQRVNQPFLAGTPAIDARTQQAIAAAIQAPEYSAVKIPALAIYAVLDASAPWPSWYDRSDPKLAATLAERGRIGARLKRESIEQFRHGVAKGQVLELPNAAHYLIQSNQKEVLEAIESFAAGLALDTVGSRNPTAHRILRITLPSTRPAATR